MTNAVKYFVCGVTAMIFLAIADRQFFDDGVGLGSALMARVCDDDAANSTNRTELPRQRKPQHYYDITRTTITPKNEDLGHLKMGGMVVLYSDESNFAVPAIIMGYNKEESSTRYDLLNTVSNTHLPHVESEFIHPYQAYEEGKRASCNVGALQNPYMTPCVINSHSTRKSGVVLYEVSYLKKEDVLVNRIRATGLDISHLFLPLIACRISLKVLPRL